LRALAHPERRRILRACLSGSRAAGDLAEPSALALASISEHLRVLRTTGLIVLERDGRFRRYRTDRKLLREALARVRAVIEQTAASDPG
jgi:DNA-binding transcriptional ArsR family regulator